ncbi:MAG: amino acid ABC transporter substrate-binding protein [Candidatus Bathyarchaeia archaeon]
MVLNREAITKIQAAVIFVIVVVALIAGIAYYYAALPTPTPATPTPATLTPATLTPATLTPATLTPATPTTPLPSEIRLGTVQHLSGPLTMMGQYALIGLQIGVKWVNDRGGVNLQGQKIPVRLIYYDDECRIEYAQSLVEKLIVEDKIHFCVPPWTPDFVMATVPICEKHKIVSFSPGGGSDEEYKQGFKYMIQYGFHGSRFAYTPLETVRKLDPTVKKIAVIASDADVGGVILSGFYDAVKIYGYEIVYEKIYPETITDAAPLLREVVASNPDYFYGGTFPASGMLIASQLRDLKINFKYVLLTMVADKREFGEAFGKWAVGFLSGAQYDERTRWDEKAKKEGKEYIGPTNSEIKSYWKSIESGMVRPEVGQAAPIPAIMAKCVEDAQSLDPEKIVKAALALDIYTCKGRFKLDPDNPAHQTGLLECGYMVQWQRDGDKLVYNLIAPIEFATGQLVQMPTWEEKEKWPELQLVW